MSKLKIETLAIGPIQTNCYILRVEGNSNCWIIDPGGLARGIIKKINSFNLTPKAILITHGHWDHFIGNRSLKKEYPDAEIMIHHDDRSALPDPDNNMSLSFFGKSIISPPADRILHEADTLELDNFEFRVIHTPGHSPGSVSFYCMEAGVLISGDLLFAGGGVGRTDLPKSSPEDLQASIKRIFREIDPDTTVYPGHGPATTIKELSHFLSNTGGEQTLTRE